MKTVYAPIGSVSSGTMRPEDLIPTLMNCLDDIRERQQANCPVSYVVDINERGSCTLWEATLEQPTEPIWSIV